ncbi:MAG: response regulator, partial [Pseudomonadales bacterium]|nr:response regulator [Pseudomonadales bacterium]
LDAVDIPYKAYADAQSFLSDLQSEERGCLVLDIKMPGMSGLELQQKLLQMDIIIPIIFITGHGDIPMAVEAMRRGAVDFIRKPFSDQELLDRVEQAFELDGRQHSLEENIDELQARVSSLTARESEVFNRVTMGQANKVIAIELGISERTVEIHRSNVMKKTEVRTLADLVRLKLELEQLSSE